jgi:carbon starvation protein CstA
LRTWDVPYYAIFVTTALLYALGMFFYRRVIRQVEAEPDPQSTTPAQADPV